MENFETCHAKIGRRVYSKKPTKIAYSIWVEKTTHGLIKNPSFPHHKTGSGQLDYNRKRIIVIKV